MKNSDIKPKEYTNLSQLKAQDPAGYECLIAEYVKYAGVSDYGTIKVDLSVEPSITDIIVFIVKTVVIRKGMKGAYVSESSNGELDATMYTIMFGKSYNFSATLYRLSSSKDLTTMCHNDVIYVTTEQQYADSFNSNKINSVLSTTVYIAKIVLGRWWARVKSARA